MNCLEKSVKGDMIKILEVQILISKKKSRQEWKRWYHTQHRNLEGIQFSQPYTIIFVVWAWTFEVGHNLSRPEFLSQYFSL